jgi:hypothetical protein
MVARLFRLGYPEGKALERLGAAALLHWSEIPPATQELIVMQAVAMADDDTDVHVEIARLTGNSPD